MANAEFGTVFWDEIAIASFDGGSWSETELKPSNQLQLHPATHALHYGSSCFEGIKAFKNKKGEVCVFRIDDHINRMINSAKGLCLPVPNKEQLKSMILGLLSKYKEQVPEFPGSAYIRPTLLGTDQAIGRAAAPSKTAILFILISPVGDYFSADSKMRVLLDTNSQRCAPHIGDIKTGGNYASALPIIERAKELYNTQQVIFAPNGDVQETGAANCILINNDELITKPICSEFLPGITRDSILKVANKLGYKVTEKNIKASELIDWIKTGEVSLSGTAAVLAPVGEIVYNEETLVVNSGKNSANSMRIREYLTNIQTGSEKDIFNWLTLV